MSMPPAKQKRIEGAQRKNRATRKLLRIDGMDSNVRLMAITLIDFLNAESGYLVAWPSVSRLAKRLGISERTAKRHLVGVRRLRIFDVIQLSPKQAVEYLAALGIKTSFARCRRYAPNIYRVAEHPIWWEKQKLPDDEAKRMVALVNKQSE